MELPEFRNPFKNAKIVGDNIPNEVYCRQEPGIGRGHPQFVMSRSELMLFLSCPSRWRAGYAPKETDATYFGSLMDCLVTMPQAFNDRYVVRPTTVKATKTMACVKDGDAKEGDPVPWRSCREATDWKASQGEKEIVPAEDFEEADQAIKQLQRDELVAHLISVSRRQVMVVAEYPDPVHKMIVPVKALIDLVPHNDSAHKDSLADYKTARTAAPKDWVGVIWKRNYDAQAALFTDIYKAATQEYRESFLHIIQENAFPWQVGRRIVGEQFLHIGQLKYLSALRLYCECLTLNLWPSWDDVSAFNGWSVSEPEPYMVSQAERAEVMRLPQGMVPAAENQESDVIP